MTWFGELMRWIAAIVPRMELMPVNERGVKFKPGGKTELIEPGLYWWWPPTTDVQEIPVKRRAVSVTVRLTTKDEVTVLLEIAVVFRVNDAMKAIVETHDFDDTILEMAQKAAKPAGMTRTFTQLLKVIASEDFDTEILPRTKSSLKKFGVLVEETFVTDFSETRVFCHEGGGLAIAGEEDED